MRLHLVALVCATSAGLMGQEPTAELSTRDAGSTAGIVVPTGTRVPLSMINSVSTKSAAVGDRIYLESVFPVLVGGRIVIPPGSYVAGTVTQVVRAGRIKGRSELYVRFDSITLPNGVTRDLGGHIGGLDGQANEELDRAEGKVKGAGNKAGDARTIGEAAGVGATVGAIAGSSKGEAGRGLGIGGAGGAAAGLIAVLVTRGPDAVLAKGTTVEVVLDGPLAFGEGELEFGGAVVRRPVGEPRRE